MSSKVEEQEIEFLKAATQKLQKEESEGDLSLNLIKKSKKVYKAAENYV